MKLSDKARTRIGVGLFGCLVAEIGLAGYMNAGFYTVVEGEVLCPIVEGEDAIIGHYFKIACPHEGTKDELYLTEVQKKNLWKVGSVISCISTRGNYPNRPNLKIYSYRNCRVV